MNGGISFILIKREPIPFFKNIPDESLISYFDRGLLKQGKALDIGCGNGRNSFYLAQRGFEVDGVDFSKTSIEWGKQIAKEQSIKVNFLCQSIFEFKISQRVLILFMIVDVFIILSHIEEINT